MRSHVTRSDLLPPASSSPRAEWTAFLLSLWFAIELKMRRQPCSLSSSSSSDERLALEGIACANLPLREVVLPCEKREGDQLSFGTANKTRPIYVCQTAETCARDRND